MPKWKTMGNKSGQSDVLYGKGWHSHWNGPARCVYKYVWDMHWAWEGFVSIFFFCSLNDIPWNEIWTLLSSIVLMCFITEINKYFIACCMLLKNVRLDSNIYWINENQI